MSWAFESCWGSEDNKKKSAFDAFRPVDFLSSSPSNSWGFSTGKPSSAGGACFGNSSSSDSWAFSSSQGGSNFYSSVSQNRSSSFSSGDSKGNWAYESRPVGSSGFSDDASLWSLREKSSSTFDHFSNTASELERQSLLDNIQKRNESNSVFNQCWGYSSSPDFFKPTKAETKSWVFSSDEKKDSSWAFQTSSNTKNDASWAYHTSSKSQSSWAFSSGSSQSSDSKDNWAYSASSSFNPFRSTKFHSS